MMRKLVLLLFAGCYLMGFGQNPSLQTINASACQTYTTQQGQIITQSGTYVETIPNVLGIDSLIITYLQISIFHY